MFRSFFINLILTFLIIYYFKKTISIEIKNGNPSKSPIYQKEKQETDRQLKAEKEILSDPSIQKFLDKYDGNIKDGSIKPIN